MIQGQDTGPWWGSILVSGVSGLAERKPTIVAGVAIALILLFIIRRRR